MGRLYRSIIRMEHHCSSCGLIFEREQGYFIGAIYINILGTQLFIVGAMLVYMIALRTFDRRLLVFLLVLGVLLPVIFFRYSRGLWLAVDHIIDPPKTEGIDSLGPMDDWR